MVVVELWVQLYWALIVLALHIFDARVCSITQSVSATVRHACFRDENAFDSQVHRDLRM